jgi:hypothetical protein
MRRHLLAPVLAGLAFVALSGEGHGGFITGISLTKDGDGKNGTIPYDSLVKLLNGNLANAQQVNIYDGLCFGGGILAPAATLTMPYYVGVGQSDPSKKTVDGDSETDVNPPGRLKIQTGTKDGNPVYTYFYSYSAYLTKRLADTANIPTAAGLQKAAADASTTDPDLKAAVSPKAIMGNGANPNLAINGGTKSSSMLYFVGNPAGLNLDPFRKTVKVVSDAAYGFAKAPNTLGTYVGNYTKVGGVELTGQGTLAGLESALANLKATIAANPKQALVNIDFDGNGYREAEAAPKAQGAAPGPKDGAIFGNAPGGLTTVSLTLDAEFWTDLSAQLTSQGAGLVRGALPEFILGYSEASASDPVTIMIGNLTLGSFSLTNSSSGDELQYDLPDPFTLQLLSEYDNATSLPIEFLFGSSSDSFRIATPDDVDTPGSLYTGVDYGVGIATTVAEVEYEPGVVPEPPSLGLLATGLFASLGWAWKRRRRP